MSNYPTSIDNDASIPSVNDNITEIGAEAINALKEAVINIESELGIGLSGSVADLATRLDVALNPDGTINSSVLISAGLVTLPITNSQISATAQIDESKLNLNYPTSTLNTSIALAEAHAQSALGWINLNSNKISSHIDGTSFFHTLSAIEVASDSSGYLKNKYLTNRDNTNSYTFIDDLNSDFVDHQRKDGTTVSSTNVTTLGGGNYPDNYSHTAGAIYINTNNFATIPQTTNTLQELAEFIDNTSIFLYGSRVQNFYSNGVSKASRSVSLKSDTRSIELIPATTARTYLRNDGTTSVPVDDISEGDDIIEFTPEDVVTNNNLFDAQFSLVNAGDIVVVNYGTVQAEFIVKEKKYLYGGGKQYIIRINGTNLKYTTSASVSIYRKQYTTDKQHVLALANAENVDAQLTSLIAIHPRSASVLGIGFNPNLLDTEHYNLYLAFYPNGNLDGYEVLPAIDVTGNAGTTPGRYTLEYIVNKTNLAFRINGYNYRFAAYQYNGEFGIALTDPYSNSAFSIISGTVDSAGAYDQTSTVASYPNNVVDVFDYLDTLSETQKPKDALGFGPSAANIASPPYLGDYATEEQALYPTKVFFPLKRNYYYVNGTERDTFSPDVNQITDGYGDGYWLAEITDVTVIPGPSGRVDVTYKVPYDLLTSNIKIGKTLVIQPLTDGYFIDSGRFMISDISSNMCDGYSDFTSITVYDAVHGFGSSPTTTADIGTFVKLYFNYDSIGFNDQNASDDTVISPFKRYFEVYVNQDGKTFAHERARMSTDPADITVLSQTLYGLLAASNIDVCYISPKLKGYTYGSIKKISLNLDYTSTTGLVLAYLNNYNGVANKTRGPIAQGFIGERIRVYDESNIDFIEIRLDIDNTVASFSSENIDIQLYNSLELDQELFLLGSCLLNTSTNRILVLNDLREFGNVAEKDISKSLIDFIGMGDKYLHSNGVVSGFDLSPDAPNPADNQIYLTGGIASVNGRFALLNADTVEIPVVKENVSSSYYNVLWALCVNDKSEYVSIPITDIQISGNYTPGSRKVSLTELTSATTYKVESSTIEKLLVRKDLVILYLVNSVITGTGPYTTTLNIMDMKRYAYSTDSYSAKYTDIKEFGNYRSITSIVNNLRFNGSNISFVDVNGAVEGCETDLVLTQSNIITISGGGPDVSSILFTDRTLNVKNIHFKNLRLQIENTTTNNVLNIDDKCEFENCEISITMTGSGFAAGYAIQVGDNVKFNNCAFDINYDDIAASGEKMISLIGNNIEFTNCTFISSFGQSVDFNSSPYYIYGSARSNVKIKDSSFTGNERSSIYFTNSSKIEIVNNTFNTTLDASTYVPGYSSSNICNYFYEGIVHINSSSTGISNILIRNNSYTSSVYNRKDFCSVVFSGSDARIKNLTIENNYFEDTSSSEVQHTALSVIYTSTSPNILRTGYLEDCIIRNNYCNKDQGFLVTSNHYSSDDKMYIKMIPINVVIENNLCGSIGYYGGSSKKTTSIGYNHTSNRYSSNLVISRNTTNLVFNARADGKQQRITTLDTGVTVNLAQYATCETKISENTSSYILVGIAYNTDSSLKIVDNICPALDKQWLVDNIGYSYIGGNTVVSYSIIVDSLKHNAAPTASTSRPANDENSSCIISNNTIHQGFWLNSSGVAYLVQPIGYIYSRSSSVIENNYCRDTQGNLTHLISVGAANCIIKGNNISRNGVDSSGTTEGYFGFYNDESTAWDGANSQGLVVDNIMDSEYLDVSLADNIVKNKFPNTWTVTRNINQVGYQSFSIISDTVEYISGGVIQSTLIDSDVAFARLQDASSNTYSSLMSTMFCSNTTQDKLVQVQYNLGQSLPDNVRVLSASMRIKKLGAGTLNSSSPASEFRISLNRLTTSFSNPKGSIDLTSITTSDTFVETSTIVTQSLNSGLYDPAAVNTVFSLSLAAVSSATEKFVINDRSPIMLSFNCLFQVATGNLNIILSPMVVKYKW